METNSELPVLALVEVKPSQLALRWELGGNRKRQRRRTLGKWPGPFAAFTVAFLLTLGKIAIDVLAWQGGKFQTQWVWIYGKLVVFKALYGMHMYLRAKRYTMLFFQSFPKRWHL